MRKNLPSNCLTDLEFGTIGLGDSSYEKFNFTAKKLYRRLIQLGAKPLLDICLCDDQHSDGIEGAFIKWTPKLWSIIDSRLNRQASNSTNSIIFKYRLIYDSEQSLNIQSELEGSATESKPFYSKLTLNQRVTADDHWQNVRLIELDSNTESLAYDPGDVLVLRPSNFKDTIDKFHSCFSHLKLDLKQRIKIVENYSGEIEPSVEVTLVNTIGDLVEKYFDLNSIPRLSFFETFAQISSDELEKEKLEEFLRPDGLEDLYNYCYRPRRTIIEVFSDFPKSCKNITSLEMLLELIPSIKSRSFSIASSPFVHRDKIQLLVAVVEYKTRLYENRKGTCSYWLSTLRPEDNVYIPVWIRKGSFSLNWNKPVICIGPGTGVAPFRSIINQRIFKHCLTENHLYFGCRSRFKDFYFENEWNEIIRDKPGYLRLNPAFSRDQDIKIYVQDLLLENGEEVWKLLDDKEAQVLIAGNSKRMPQDVMAILQRVIHTNLAKQNPNMSQEELESLVKDYLKNLETKRRIQMETWS